MTTSPARIDRLTRLATLTGRLIPDALSTSVAMLALVLAAALALGDSLLATMDAYYRGLWMLLPFAMQVSLLLVLSSSLGAAPLFRKLAIWLSGLPRTTDQAIALTILLTACLSYLYWGLGLALGPLSAAYIAREAERRGLRVDYPFLLSLSSAAGSVWQFGLSASAPLLMNTPGHFLESTTGRMPLATTLFAPASIAFVAAFVLALIVVARALAPRAPRAISEFPEASAMADLRHAAAADAKSGPESASDFSARLEAHPLPVAVLGLALLGWLVYHFGIKGGGLELNAHNTILLLLCLVFHGNVRSFTKALQAAVASVWPVLVLFHVYAGVGGLIQYTTVGESFASLFASMSTRLTFPLIIALEAAIVSLFVPTSGGHWVIQGFVVTRAAEAVGVSAQRGLLAFGAGDQAGSPLSPIWIVVAAGIARVDFRSFIGYNLVFSLLWFVLGVLAFTFLPA